MPKHAPASLPKLLEVFQQIREQAAQIPLNASLPSTKETKDDAEMYQALNSMDVSNLDGKTALARYKCNATSKKKRAEHPWLVHIYLGLLAERFFTSSQSSEAECHEAKRARRQICAVNYKDFNKWCQKPDLFGETTGWIIKRNVLLARAVRQDRRLLLVEPENVPWREFGQFAEECVNVLLQPPKAPSLKPSKAAKPKTLSTPSTPKRQTTPDRAARQPKSVRPQSQGVDPKTPSTPSTPKRRSAPIPRVRQQSKTVQPKTPTTPKRHATPRRALQWTAAALSSPAPSRSASTLSSASSEHSSPLSPASSITLSSPPASPSSPSTTASLSLGSPLHTSPSSSPSSPSSESSASRSPSSPSSLSASSPAATRAAEAKSTVAPDAPVLSFCLFKKRESKLNDSFPEYVRALTKLVPHLKISDLSDWRVVVYVNATVPEEVKEELLQCGVDDVKDIPSRAPSRVLTKRLVGFPGYTGTLMRYWAFADYYQTASHVLCLDADMPFSARLERVVLTWRQSARPKQDVLRLTLNSYDKDGDDNVPLCGGFFGLAGAALQAIGAQWFKLLSVADGKGDIKDVRYGVDQYILAKHVFPVLQNKYQFGTIVAIGKKSMPKPQDVLRAGWKVKRERIYEGRTFALHEIV